MVDHHRSKHQNEGLPNPEADYRFEVLAKHKEPMTRQIEEAVRIQTSIQTGLHIDTKGRSHKVKTLNRKNEHFTARKRFDFD